MNTQPILKQLLNLHGKLNVHSIFPTIQGEGPFAGVPATFIRLAGCNLQCPGCDTAYTKENLDLVDPDDILRQVEYIPHPTADHHRHLVVITGGEPFRQNIGPAVGNLLSRGYRVQIETNGTLYVDGPWTHSGVTIVCSPKTPKVNEALRPYISAYKYIIDHRGPYDPFDGLPILGLHPNPVGNRVARPPVEYRGPIYIQPLDEKDPEANRLNQKAAVGCCMAYGYTMCLQLHKIVGLE